MSVISVSHLSKFYRVQQKEPGFLSSIKSFFARKHKEVRAVDDISFEIKEGELIGFIGPNGAGKTTTLKILSGLLYPTSGQVTVGGFVPWQRKPEFQKQFAFVAGQKNQLWWDLPAWETFLLNKEIYQIPDQDFKERIKYFSSLLNLEDLLTIPVKKLSLGQRMKAELVAALLHNPRILFLDEPTIGLDVVAQNQIREFIKDYNQRTGATIILTSHYMGDVEKLCRRVIIINKGKILYNGLLSKIAQKFSKHKLVGLTLKQEVPKEEFEKIGKVIVYDWPLVKIEIPRDEVTQATSRFLNDFSVEDLSVEEMPIEEIIRLIFSKKQ